MSRVPRLARILPLAVAAGAGAVAAAAAFLPNGLLLTGSACAGGGEEQVCTGVARGLSLVEVSPRAWLFVGGGLFCLAFAAAALLALRRGRTAALPLAAALAALTAVGLFAVEGVGAHVEPAESGGTVGRLLEDWHPFLEPELADMRADALAKYEGKRAAPDGPVYDREQILDSFSVRAQAGWSLFHAAVVTAFFAALLALAFLLAGSPALAVTLAGTAGIVTWALAWDGARPCDSDASECYDGFVTVAAVVLAVVWWAVYWVAASAGRRRSAP